MCCSIEGDKEIITAADVNKIIDVQFIQTLQDFYAQTMDISLVCVYENNWITDPSNTCSFCREYTRRNNSLHQCCSHCHREWEKHVKEKGFPEVFDCHLCMKNIAVPITVEGIYLGCAIGGQVFTKPPDENYYKKIAREHGINEKDYLLALKNVKVIPEEKINAAAELLFLIANSLAAVAYANYHLTKSGVEYKIPRNKTMEEWFFSNYGKMKRPISSREYDVLKLLVAGKNNSEIAKELFISVHTAKAHVSSILEKFEVEDRVQVAVKAVREGLI